MKNIKTQIHINRLLHIIEILEFISLTLGTNRLQFFFFHYFFDNILNLYFSFWEGTVNIINNILIYIQTRKTHSTIILQITPLDNSKCVLFLILLKRNEGHVSHIYGSKHVKFLHERAKRTIIFKLFSRIYKQRSNDLCFQTTITSLLLFDQFVYDICVCKVF